MDAVLIIGHGTRNEEGVSQFLEVVAMFREKYPDWIVEHGFLDHAEPSIEVGASRCVERGAVRIAAIPGLLLAAGHVKKDIPQELDRLRSQFPGVQIHMGRPFGLHPGIVQLCINRIEAGGGCLENYQHEKTQLLVIGRGSSDPDANSDAAKLTRLLWERLGLAWATTSYLAVAEPKLEEALHYCTRLKIPQLIVFPFLLFTGVLHKRIEKQIAQFSAKTVGLEIALADYLRPEPMLCGILEERAREAFDGRAVMNCELCKYRPGFQD